MGKRAKKSKIISLAKTAKKGKDRKVELISEIRTNCDSYTNIYLFSVQNMRNNRLQDLRNQWKGKGRFYLGKNRVMSIALGKTKEDEYKLNLSEISNRLIGNCGLFFTNSPRSEVESFFADYIYPDYPRAGCKANLDFSLESGLLSTVAGSMEPTLRSLGMPTVMKGGVYLEQEYSVCKAGNVLTPEQCRLLTIFNVQMAIFEVIINAVWEDTKFTLKKEVMEIDGEESSDDEEEAMDDDE